MNFLTFKVVDALEVIKADIIEEIRRVNRGGSAANLVFYFSENFPHNFTQGALLIAECLADYYRTGELIVYEYVGENYIYRYLANNAFLKAIVNDDKICI